TLILCYFSLLFSRLPRFTDIDNNGFLDNNDFQCMALRATVIEGKGEINPARLNEYKFIMKSLWDEISALADFDKDGKITTEEFKQAVKQTCVGKPYSEFPKQNSRFSPAHCLQFCVKTHGKFPVLERKFCCRSCAVLPEARAAKADAHWL
uniref:EF-hand domain-containing protein n=1 Tax=Anopheles maculatus TaxID=74869 RepID=A0A182SXP7_9DIPT